MKLVYTKFINPLVQEVEVIDLFDFSDKIDNKNHGAQLMVEPNEDFIFEQLFLQYVQIILFYIFISSKHIGQLLHSFLLFNSSLYFDIKLFTK